MAAIEEHHPLQGKDCGACGPCDGSCDAKPVAIEDLASPEKTPGQAPAKAFDEVPGASPEKTSAATEDDGAAGGKKGKSRRRRGKKPEAAPAEAAAAADASPESAQPETETPAAAAAPVDVKALLAKKALAKKGAKPGKKKELSEAQRAVLADKNRGGGGGGGAKQKRLNSKAFSDATYASGSNGWAC